MLVIVDVFFGFMWILFGMMIWFRNFMVFWVKWFFFWFICRLNIVRWLNMVFRFVRCFLNEFLDSINRLFRYVSKVIFGKLDLNWLINFWKVVFEFWRFMGMCLNLKVFSGVVNEVKFLWLGLMFIWKYLECRFSVDMYLEVFVVWSIFLILGSGYWLGFVIVLSLW